MTDDAITWIIFFLIMIPGNLLFNYWYRKDENSSNIVSIAVGFVIGIISMFVSMYIVGGLK